jgi:acylphosphatase
MSERALRLVVRGKVQGVGFRWFVRETARRCELRGWVRNNANGTVELAAAGDPDCVDRLVVAVRRGPQGARVDDVDEQPLDDASALPSPFAVQK